MSRNKNHRKKNRGGDNHDILGVTLIVISAFLLLCIAIKPILGIFSEAIFGVMLGAFGISSYPMLIATLLLGVYVLQRRTPHASRRTVIRIVLLVLCSLMILQLATTHAFLDYRFSDYIDSVYSAKYSAGGVILGLPAYGLAALISEPACYVLFSVAILAIVAVMTSLFSRIRASGKGEKKEKPVKDGVEKQQVATASLVPIGAQYVVPVMPSRGLADVLIQPPTPVVVETGSSYELDDAEERRVSDYEDDGDNDDARVRARDRLYGDKDERDQNDAEQFLKRRQGPIEPEPTADTTVEEPAVSAQPPTPPVDTPERAESDAVKPRRVDYDGTPGNFNRVFFPLTKKIEYNRRGTIEDMDKMPTPDVPPAPPVLPVLPTSPAPEFGIKQSTRPIEQVRIIDSPRPAATDSADDRLLRAMRDERSAADSRAASVPTETPQNPIVDLSSSDITFPPDEDRFDAQQAQPRPDTESDGIMDISAGDGTDGEITDITDAPAQNAAIRQTASAPQPVTVAVAQPNTASSAPQPTAPVIQPIAPVTQPIAPVTQPIAPVTQPTGKVGEGLVVSDAPAVDLSETGFDGGDMLTGEDLSGVYVDSSQEDRPAEPEVVVKQRKSKSNQPLENQATIDSMLKDKALESVVAQKIKKYKQYRYTPPPIMLLKNYDKKEAAQEELDANSRIIETVVSQFLKAEARIVNTAPGPQVTRYELEVPLGTSVKGIETHAPDIAYELSAISGVRIEAPIPGKRAVGIEVPNKEKYIVGLRDIVETSTFTRHKSPLLFSVGKDIGGELVVCDLEKVPHLLIAGQTGSGKSAGLNSLIVSLLYKSSPEDLRFILIDPKRVEFSKFRGMPHLLFENTVFEPGEALNALKWAHSEMEKRYNMLQAASCSNLAEYNASPQVKDGTFYKMPHLVIIIDELANLMQSNFRSEIETEISSLAALARAAGIHLIVATQRPSSDVITGTIKANLTSRIAFRVPDATNSRIILDTTGAEALAGDGDMLFFPQDASSPKRVQGSFVGSEEILSVVGYLKDNYETDFDTDAEKFVAGNKAGGGGSGGGQAEMDPLTSQVMAHAIRAGQLSTTVIQRRFSIGYARAARIVDNMFESGYVGEQPTGNKPRDVLMTEEQYRQLFGHGIDDN